jgi:anti-sigma factor RsiW
MRINHHRSSQLLSAYLDGELLPAEAAAVQDHLLECAPCRAAYEGLRITKGLLGELPVAEPPAEFWEAVRRPPPTRAVARISWWTPALQRGVLGGLAAALIVLALALVPMIKGTVDRLHAAEIGVDLYVREHALQMSTEPLADRAYLGVITGDSDLVLAGESAHRQAGGR